MTVHASVEGPSRRWFVELVDGPGDQSTPLRDVDIMKDTCSIRSQGSCVFFFFTLLAFFEAFSGVVSRMFHFLLFAKQAWV